MQATTKTSLHVTHVGNSQRSQFKCNAKYKSEKVTVPEENNVKVSDSVYEVESVEFYLIRLSPNNANSINYDPSTVAARIQTHIFHSLARFIVILTWPRIYNYYLFPMRGPELVAKSIKTLRDYTIY